MTERTGRRRALRLALSWALALLPVVLVVVVIRGRWSEVSAAGGLPGWGPATIAVLANVVGNLLLVHAWRRQVALTGTSTPPMAASVVVWSTSQLSRLLFPGAPIGARAALARRHGVRASVGAWTTILEIAWQLSIGPLVILATLPAWRGVAGGWTWLGVLAIVPGALLLGLVVRPAPVLRLVARLLRRVPGLRRRVPDDVEDVAVDLRPRDAWGLFGVYAANYLTRTVAFLALVAAVAPLDGPLVALAVGASALGRFIGMLALFAPGGIGPREGITALVLAPTLGPAVLVLVAGARLAEVVAEALVYLGGRVAAGTPDELVDEAPPTDPAAAGPTDAARTHEGAAG